MGHRRYPTASDRRREPGWRGGGLGSAYRRCRLTLRVVPVSGETEFQIRRVSHRLELTRQRRGAAGPEHRLPTALSRVLSNDRLWQTARLDGGLQAQWIPLLPNSSPLTANTGTHPSLEKTHDPAPVQERPTGG